MPEQSVEKTRRSSMDEGAIKELLESDEFVNAMRQILGLKKDEYQACDLCQETETEVRKLSASEYRNLDEDRSVHYCSSCEKVVKQPLRKTRWKEQEHSVMTREGVEMYISNVRGLADKIIFTSNFTTKEIGRIMENYHKNLAEELYQNWNQYGIESSAMAKKITGLTTDLIWAGYNRALQGKTLEGVVSMGDDRTIKKADNGRENRGWRSKIGFGSK